LSNNTSRHKIWDIIYSFADFILKKENFQRLIYNIDQKTEKRASANMFLPLPTLWILKTKNGVRPISRPHPAG